MYVISCIAVCFTSLSVYTCNNVNFELYFMYLCSTILCIDVMFSYAHACRVEIKIGLLERCNSGGLAETRLNRRHSDEVECKVYAEVVLDYLPLGQS